MKGDHDMLLGNGAASKSLRDEASNSVRGKPIAVVSQSGDQSSDPASQKAIVANDHVRTASETAEHVASLEARVELLQRALKLTTAGLRLEYPGEGAVVDTLPFEVKQIVDETHVLDEGLEHRQPNGQILSISQRKLGDGAILTVVQNITDEHGLREALDRETLTDQATGGASLRAAETLGAELIQIYARYRRVFSVLRIDALGLEQYALDQRDTIIRHIANVGRRSLRAVDILARKEGGSFIAILPESDREGASVAAKRLCYKLEAAELMIGGKTIDTPVCVGVEEYEPSFETFAELCRAAEVRVLKAKEAHPWTVR